MTSNAMYFYIPTSLWCVTWQHSTLILTASVTIASKSASHMYTTVIVDVVQQFKCFLCFICCRIILTIVELHIKVKYECRITLLWMLATCFSPFLASLLNHVFLKKFSHYLYICSWKLRPSSHRNEWEQYQLCLNVRGWSCKKNYFCGSDNKQW